MVMETLLCPDCDGRLTPSNLASVYFTGDCLVCRTCSLLCDLEGRPVTYAVKSGVEKVYKSERGALLETQLHLALVGFMIEMEQTAGVGKREGDDSAQRAATERLRAQVLGESAPLN